MDLLLDSEDKLNHISCLKMPFLPPKRPSPPISTNPVVTAAGDTSASLLAPEQHQHQEAAQALLDDLETRVDLSSVGDQGDDGDDQVPSGSQALQDFLQTYEEAKASQEMTAKASQDKLSKASQDVTAKPSQDMFSNASQEDAVAGGKASQDMLAVEQPANLPDAKDDTVAGDESVSELALQAQTIDEIDIQAEETVVDVEVPCSQSFFDDDAPPQPVFAKKSAPPSVPMEATEATLEPAAPVPEKKKAPCHRTVAREFLDKCIAGAIRRIKKEEKLIKAEKITKGGKLGKVKKGKVVKQPRSMPKRSAGAPARHVDMVATQEAASLVSIVEIR